ncbi:Trans-2-enoyl-CoA reductase, mitochondrial [Cytospora mali]|uniref:Trans-2-enoyl-CoA reductase, mitochondrial n=1 Tax=Cytospora mali TaxID=578113 RepID=A0A194VPR8_CYTMA|nr:Trans-2-enoyl-CoA reductase, mitochondrial [Valsa mali]
MESHRYHSTNNVRQVSAGLLLHEVRALTEGDAIIMSAGTSTVACFLVQLARLRGIPVFLVVRDRAPDQLGDVKDRLLGLGAAAVVCESELRDSLAGRAPSCLPAKPTLALDCVFGPVGKLLVESLAPGGAFVLVGLLGGAGANIQVETRHLFDRRLLFLPFRGSEVMKKLGDCRVEQIVTEIANLFIEGRLKIPEVVTVSWKGASEAGLQETLSVTIDKARSDSVGYRKIIFVMS